MRKLDPVMLTYFEEKLKGNALAAHAIKTKNPRLLLVETVKTGVGIKEKTGKNDGVLVEAIQRTCGGSRGHAWCMYWVQCCVAYVEHVLGIKSPLASGGHCLTVWNKTPKEQRVKFLPLPGAIPIWRHGTSTNGHTEIVLAADNKVMHCVGGNTSGADGTGKVTREGNGIFYTERSMQGFPSVKTKSGMILVGFLKPF